MATPINSYRQKPPVVTGFQYDGTNAQDVIDFTGGKAVQEDGALKLQHYEGSEKSVINVTDWVLKQSVTGVFSSMPDAYFKAAYELNVAVTRKK